MKKTATKTTTVPRPRRINARGKRRQADLDRNRALYLAAMRATANPVTEEPRS